MLVLGRKVGEALLVDHEIRIVVLSVDRRGVRLGIEAPPSCILLREELVTEVAEENRRAAVATLSAVSPPGSLLAVVRADDPPAP